VTGTRHVSCVHEFGGPRGATTQLFESGRHVARVEMNPWNHPPTWRVWLDLPTRGRPHTGLLHFAVDDEILGVSHNVDFPTMQAAIGAVEEYLACPDGFDVIYPANYPACVRRKAVTG